MGLLKNAMGHMTTVLFSDGDSIFYDGELVTAIVSDLEESSGPIETGVVKKIVSIRKLEVPHQPREGDEVLLDFDPENPSDGDYWTVKKVGDSWHEYQIHFERYVG